MNEKEREQLEQQWKDTFKPGGAKHFNSLVDEYGRVLQPGTEAYKQKEAEIKRKKGLI